MGMLKNIAFILILLSWSQMGYTEDSAAEAATSESVDSEGGGKEDAKAAAEKKIEEKKSKTKHNKKKRVSVRIIIEGADHCEVEHHDEEKEKDGKKE